MIIVNMSKVSGLQLVKPRFDWDAKDKLTEIEQFKVDCKILFDGPLSDLKEKKGWFDSELVGQRGHTDSKFYLC